MSTKTDALRAQLARERRATRMVIAMVAGDTRPDPQSLHAFTDDDWTTWAQVAGVEPTLYIDRIDNKLTAASLKRRQDALDGYAAAYAIVHPADPFAGLGD